MSKSLVPFSIKGIMPTAAGCAVFLGSEVKTFVIHMDTNMGQTIAMQLQHVTKERPLTHDLIQTIFMGLGVQVEHIVINDIVDATFYARLVLRMENELGQKVVEIDTRPSDAIILALQAHKPIYVSENVLNQVEDITDIMMKIMEQMPPEMPEEDGPESTF